MGNYKTTFNDHKRLGPCAVFLEIWELWQSSSCLVAHHLVKIKNQSDSFDAKTLKRWRETMHTK